MHFTLSLSLSLSLAVAFNCSMICCYRKLFQGAVLKCLKMPKVKFKNQNKISRTSNI